MDWLDGPETEIVKSAPIPERVICLAEANDALETVTVPDCCPAVVGTNAIRASQLAPISKAEPHVVEATWNPPEAEIASEFRATAPSFVKITVSVALVVPTPVVGNVRVEGWIESDPAAPPIPASANVAALENADDATVSAPDTVPLAVGVKRMFAVQLAPGARELPQGF